MKLLQRVLFSRKDTHLFMYAVMSRQEALKKQHCARGGTKKWRQTPFAVIAYASAWQKALQNRKQIELHVNCVWGWCIWREKYPNSRKYTHLLFEEPLKFILHGHIFERLRYRTNLSGGHWSTFSLFHSLLPAMNTCNKYILVWWLSSRGRAWASSTLTY